MNETKLTHLIFNYNTIDNSLPDVVMGQTKIPRADSTKFLGIVLDEKLKWDKHVQHISNKISKLCGLIYLMRKSLNLDAMKCIYYSLAYSHIIYCISVWGGCYARHANQLKYDVNFEWTVFT